MDNEGVTDPGELLEAVDEIRIRVRERRSGRWFPLVVLAVVVLGAAPFYSQRPVKGVNIHLRDSRTFPVSVSTASGMEVVDVTCGFGTSKIGPITSFYSYRLEQRSGSPVYVHLPAGSCPGQRGAATFGGAAPSGASMSLSLYRAPFSMVFSSGEDSIGAGTLAIYRGLYWLIALSFAFVLIGGWSVIRSRRMGMKSRWLPFVASGIGSFALLVALTPGGFAAFHMSITWTTLLSMDVVSRGITPLLAIAASLLVYAWSEQDLALSVFAVVFAGVCALVNFYDLGTVASSLGLPSSSVFGLALVGGVLLLGGLAVATDNVMVKRWMDASGDDAAPVEEVSFA